MYSIDSCIIKFLSSYNIKTKLSMLYPAEGPLIALIGENDKLIRKDRLRYRVNKALNNDPTVFTVKDPFKISYSNDFDLFISVRPCNCQDILLELHDMGKKVIFLPCDCNNIHKTTAQLIRQYPKLNLHTEVGDDGFAWYILYNLNNP